MRTISSPTPPRLRPGETILGCADIEDLMTQWVIAEGGDVPALVEVPEPVTTPGPRRRMPQPHTRRRHDGRLRKLCQGRR